MRVKKGGDSYELRKTILLFLLQLIIVPIIFVSVYNNKKESLAIYKGTI
ncbi:hypothetical protein D8843_00990 [Streptococcus mitis]|uniref:Uncharacterized protein n=1 Tax=Streptococcus mitis TaxID=28037 RepID=A0A428DWC8_STRMT|nr:hypothetical protein D8843_00990 [Streptococcus mitis]